MEGSTKLASSEIDGSLHPFRPPTSLSAQAARASDQDSSVVSKVFSHTSPVSSSRTAAFPKSLKTENREALGSFLLQFWRRMSGTSVAKALFQLDPRVNILPINKQSPGISMKM